MAAYYRCQCSALAHIVGRHLKFRNSLGDLIRYRITFCFGEVGPGNRSYLWNRAISRLVSRTITMDIVLKKIRISTNTVLKKKKNWELFVPHPKNHFQLHFLSISAKASTYYLLGPNFPTRFFSHAPVGSKSWPFVIEKTATGKNVIGRQIVATLAHFVGISIRQQKISWEPPAAWPKHERQSRFFSE